MPSFDFDSLPDKKEEKPKILSMNANEVRVQDTLPNGSNIITNYNQNYSCLKCGKGFASEQTGECLICDNVMTTKEFEDFQKKYTKKEEKAILKPSEIKEAIKKNATTKEKDAFDSVPIVQEAKIEAYNEASVIPLETKKPQPKITKPKVEEYPIEIIDKLKPNELKLPPKKEVDAYFEMYKYVKRSIVDPSDFQLYQGVKRMKKSGWRKFIKPFNLSVEIIREEELGKPNPRVFESGKCQDGSPDIHAEVYIKVYITNIFCADCGKEMKGQTIESIGLKSRSEYWSDKYKNFGGYDLHNLITTARTRAENQGISDLVGFGEVSYEEFKGNTVEKDAFGGE